jgi:hypothetical protein
MAKIVYARLKSLPPRGDGIRFEFLRFVLESQGSDSWEFCEGRTFHLRHKKSDRNR